jgi:MFS family permease
MASGFWSMLLRLLPGAAQARDRPSSVAAICCRFPVRSRSRFTSVALSAQYIGPVIGSIATGVLAYRDSWRFCFIAYALVGFRRRRAVEGPDQAPSESAVPQPSAARAIDLERRRDLFRSFLRGAFQHAEPPDLLG